MSQSKKKKTKKVSDKPKSVDEVDDDPATEAKRKGYYFDNHAVEQLLTEYVRGGCTDVDLRNKIMTHAGELINNIIRTHNFHNLYPGRDEASYNDLFQTAWMQIESVLYKFDCGPGHTKVFNYWSQIAKTVIQAYIKKNTRDKRNFNSFKNHVTSKPQQNSGLFERFAAEAKEICKYNDDYGSIIEALEEIHNTDERPHDRLIGKLMEKTDLSRQKISSFLTYVRLRSPEFTDSPINTKHTKKILNIDDGGDDFPEETE